MNGFRCDLDFRQIEEAKAFTFGNHFMGGCRGAFNEQQELLDGETRLGKDGVTHNEAWQVVTLFRSALDSICDPVSLYEPVYSDSGESVCVMDQIGDTKNTDEHWLEQIALDEAVGRLSERERRILSLRFYLGRTQTEVAREIGISQAQVSRLEKNAMGRIKKELGS